VPSWWQGKQILVHFGAVAEWCQVYCNGQLCGGHDEGLLPFDVDVSEQVKVGESNELRVYVEALSLHGEKITVGEEERWVADHITERAANPEPGYTLNRAGIWQGVYLQARPHLHIADIFVMPSVRNKRLTVRAWVTNDTDEPQTVRLIFNALRDSDSHLSMGSEAMEIPAGQTQMIETAKRWPDPHLWDISDPFLYFLHSELIQGGEPIDETHTQFGFRELWIEGTEFVFNGRKIFLQGDSPCWATPWHPDDNQWTAGYRRVFYTFFADCNMNLIRSHVSGIGDYLSPEVADRMGMMLQPEAQFLPWTYAKRGGELSDDFGHSERQFRDWIRAMRNHPSVVMWSGDNETVVHNFEPQNEDEEWRMDTIFRFQEIIKAEDPTRIVAHHGVQPTCKDPRFEVADIHYPPMKHADNWQEKYAKPLFIGEIAYEGVWSFFQSGIMNKKRDGQDYRTPYWRKIHGVAHTMHGLISQYVQRGVPGLQPYASWQWHWNPDNPVWESYDDAQYRGRKDLQWPALSGPGMKPEYMIAMSPVMNWFDPAARKAYRNIAFDGLRKAWHSRPPLRADFAPEVIVQAIADGTPVGHAYVWAVPLEGQGCGVTAIKADGEGKAWFRLPEAGRYRMVAQVGEKFYSAEVSPEPPGEWSQVKLVRLTVP